MNPRLFIAFEVIPTETFLKEFAEIRKTFSRERLSWAKPTQLHITLKFLGETPQSRIDVIKTAMNEAFAEEKSAIMRLESLGVFGSSYAPKVLWSHVKPEEVCRRWFQNLKTALQDHGFEYDRQNFVPHLTLARIKSLDDKKLLNAVVEKHSSFCFNEFSVKEIILFESILKPTGAEYIKHFAVSLS